MATGYLRAGNIARACLVLLGAFLVALDVARGQTSLTDDWRWVQFGVADGLPSPIVRVVIRATDGTMWAGTDNGPAWFDGYRWQVVRTADGRVLGGERATRLVAGARGMVVLAVGSRLYRVAAAGAAADLLPAHPGGLLPREFAVLGDDVWRIHSREAQWILSRFRGGAWHDEPWPGAVPASGFGTRLHVAASGSLVLTVGGRLWVRSGTSWQPGTTFTAERGVITHLLRAVSGEERVVLQSPDSQQGVWAKGPSTGQAGWMRFAEFGFEAPVAFDLGPDGSAAAMLDAGDFLYCDTNGWRRLPAPRSLATTRELAFDAAGDVWFATRNGVMLWRRGSERWTQWRLAASEPANRVNGVAVGPGGRVAAATAGGVAFTAPEGRLRFETGLPRVIYTAVAWDAKGDLWAGSGASIAGVYQRTSKGWVHRADAPGLATAGIHRIVTGRDGALWLLGLPHGTAAGGGVWRIVNGNIEAVAMPAFLAGARFYDLAEDSAGGRWFVTSAGVVRQRGDVVDRIDVAHGLGGDLPFSITLGDEGSVWVGLRADGVARITSDLRVERPDPAAPFPHGYVRSLHRTADGNVWAANDDGIWVMSGGTWSLLTETFGLATPAVWPVTSSGDDIYVGTLGVGVLRLRLAELRAAVPEVRPRQPAQGSDGLELRWVVAAPRGLVAPADVTSRWHLDDGAWSAWSSSTTGTVAGLLPWGRHVLYVEARTPLGVQTTQPARQEFVVPPPLWWRRAVLLPLAALVAMLLWVSVLLWRRRSQNRVLARRVREAERMEIVGGFAAGMAHELNNLLATVVLNSDLVVDEARGDSGRSPAAEIRRAALQAAGQVRSLQAFTRDQALLLHAVDLRDELARQRDAVDALFGPNIDTDWTLGGVAVRVRAEVNGLAGILRALAVNANDAMPAGGHFRVVLTAGPLSDDRRRHLGLSDGERFAEVAVSDSGVGMTSGETSRAFEPYFSTRGQPGLGLALVYGLTQRFGGAVELDAQPGRGTTVRLFLPLVDDDTAKG